MYQKYPLFRRFKGGGLVFFPHIDTLYFSASPRDTKKYFEILEFAKAAKESGEKFYKGVGVIKGHKNYTYGIINDVGVWCNLGEESKLGTALPLYFRVPSEVMLQYHQSLDKLIKFCSEPFGGFLETKVSRIDLTVDSDECQVTPLWTKKLLCQAFNGSWVEMEKSQSVDSKLSYYIQDNPFLKHVGFTGITFGSGDPSTVYFRIYEKLIELLRKKGNVSAYKDVVRSYGWKDKTIWRFEWELKRELLKNLGIDSVDQAFGAVNRIFRWLTTDWVSVGSDCRTRINRFWSNLSKVKFDISGSEPLGRISKIDVSQLEAQCVGVLSRILQEKSIDKSMLFEYLANLVANNEDKLFVWQKKEEAYLNASECVS